MIKVVVALIHNDNPKRNNYLLPKLNSLVEDLSKTYQIEFIKIYRQPKIEFKNTLPTIARKAFLWKINRQWLVYRKLKPRPWPIDILVLIQRSIRVYLQRTSENRRFSIDIAVTSKHIKAWDMFMERGADFLICFEDDLVFKPDSARRLKSLLRDLRRFQNGLIYVDLAGGVDLSVLRIEKLLWKKDKGRRFYRKPVTNTACGYLINMKTAMVFLSLIARFPWLRYLPSDWLMNKLFINMRPGHRFHSFQTDPTVFNHGSLTGDYSSWL